MRREGIRHGIKGYCRSESALVIDQVGAGSVGDYGCFEYTAYSPSADAPGQLKAKNNNNK